MVSPGVGLHALKSSSMASRSAACWNVGPYLHRVLGTAHKCVVSTNRSGERELPLKEHTSTGTVNRGELREDQSLRTNTFGSRQSKGGGGEGGTTQERQGSAHTV